MLFLLGILPAVLLLVFIRRKDKVEKEPAGLLVKLFLLGALSTVFAVIVGTAAEKLIGFFVPLDSTLGIFLNYFFAVALVEETGKYIMLKKGSWNHPAFNYTFDAAVYAVTVSLGFATLENLMYLADGSVHLAILRGVLSVPGHAIDGVYMGFFYGAAKRCALLGDDAGQRRNLRFALIVPTLLHGFYDFTLSLGSTFAMIAFFVFEIIVTIAAVRLVNRLSREDAPMPGTFPEPTAPPFDSNQINRWEP